MEIITTPFNFNEAIELVNENADIILLTNSDFGLRNNYNCTNDELLKIFEHHTKKKSTSKIWININAFFFEQDIEKLEKYLNFLNIHINQIDRIVFNDFAVNQICFEQGYKFKLHYDPSTLVTSYGQFDFYIENNINSVSLSNELFLPEVITILKNKPKDLEIAIQVHGYVFIMHSRWNLISNFKNYVEDNNDEYIKQKVYYIKELNRKFTNIIYEDKHGSHMLSGYELCLLNYIKQLNDLGLNYIKIDDIYQTENYSLNIYKIYKNAISSIKNNCFNLEQINNDIEECKKYSKNKILSSGFIGGIGDILNYEKK